MIGIPSTTPWCATARRSSSTPGALETSVRSGSTRCSSCGGGAIAVKSSPPRSRTSEPASSSMSSPSTVPVGRRSGSMTKGSSSARGSSGQPSISQVPIGPNSSTPWCPGPPRWPIRSSRQTRQRQARRSPPACPKRDSRAPWSQGRPALSDPAPAHQGRGTTRRFWS